MERNELKTKILALLERNARISTKEIAERLACEEALIAALIDELEKSHVIMGYSAIVSDLANSSEVRAIIEVEVQPERDTGFDKIAERLGRRIEPAGDRVVRGGETVLPERREIDGDVFHAEEVQGSGHHAERRR